MYKNISPFFLPWKNFISVQIFAISEREEKQFHAAWFLWFVFWVVSPLFLVLFLLLLSSLNCLPPVFPDMQISITAVFLVSSFTFSPALLGFPESFVFFCSHPVSRSRLPRALLLPVCTVPEEPKLFPDLTTCALLISLIISFPKTDSIPFLIQGLQPLDPFACWYKSCLCTSF